MGSEVQPGNRGSKMAQVVYTNIEQIERLGAASWILGDQDSYERTQRMAGRHGYGISLVGRQGKGGSVGVCYAKADGTDWSAVNGFHLTLANYFTTKLISAPAGDVLAPFFDRIDDQAAANAVVQLVGADVGINAAPDEVKSAINRIGASLRALGVTYGDWAFLPMLAAWKAGC